MLLTGVAQLGADAGSSPGELERLRSALVVGVGLEIDRDESGGRLARRLGEQQTGVRITEQDPGPALTASRPARPTLPSSTTPTACRPRCHRH